MFTVHLRINDGSTGKPIPVRLRITDAAGVCRPPLGRYAAFPTEPGEDVGGQVLLDGRAFALSAIAQTLVMQVGQVVGYVRARHEISPGSLERGAAS